MLSHSLSFWFRALVAHEPDLALEREVQKGCRSSGRKCVVTSPCWGCEVNVVHVHIFQEGAEVRSGRITVCLSVCLFSTREARPRPSPAPSHPVAKASAAGASSHSTSHQLQQNCGWAQPGPEQPGPEELEQSLGWQPGQGGLHGCPGCLAQPSASP